MSGPLPKPAAQRRRRNAGSRSVHLPFEGRRGAIPVLTGAKELLPSTRALWRLWWRSPMAVTWLEVDAHPLRRLAGMIDARERGEESAALASEIRQLEDRFGLSPVARRRLNYEISEGAAKVAELRAVPASGGDPRLREESDRERMARLGLIDGLAININGRGSR